MTTAILTLSLLAPVGLPADPVQPTAPKVVVSKHHPDQTGVRASEYRGRYFRSVDEQYRRCLATREGEGQYWGTGSNGTYQGTYQMTNALVRGAAWMMTDELREMFPHEWRRIRDTLLATPGHRWGRFYSDMAFWTVLNWERPRRGAFHWSGGRWTCTPGMAWTR